VIKLKNYFNSNAPLKNQSVHWESVTPKQERIAKLGYRTIGERTLDVCGALWESRIVKHLLVTAGVAVAVAFLVTPPGWFILGAGVLGALAGSLTCVVTMAAHCTLQKRKGPETLACELSAIPRLFKHDFNEILPNELYLGALPNRASLPFRTSDWDALRKLNIGAMLSINEKWERKPRGPSFPYEARECAELGISYLPIESADHQLLDAATMDRCAEFIHRQISAGKKVYVHCRAGKGRSGMAIAAYLIKYRNFTIQQAQDLIVMKRPEATIKKKTKALYRFTAYLRTFRVGPNPSS